jgi:FtsH-binding integral membrane protein
VAEPARRPPGAREALLVGIATVAVVAIAAAVTWLLPAEARDVVFRTPLLIVVLVVGTAVVLWTITRPARPDRPDRPDQ